MSNLKAVNVAPTTGSIASNSAGKVPVSGSGSLILNGKIEEFSERQKSALNIMLF